MVNDAKKTRLREFFDELRECQFQFLGIANIDVNTRGYTGDTPLKIAVVRQDLELVKFLLEYGANPNIQGEDNCAPLHHAAISENLEIVQLLLTHGASIDALDIYGVTPAGYSRGSSNPEIRALFIVDDAK